jgi:hypothetical protein
MPRKKRTPQELREAVRLRTGETARDLAKSLGVSYQRVHQLRAELKQETESDAAPARKLSKAADSPVKPHPSVVERLASENARLRAEIGGLRSGADGSDELARENHRLRALLQTALSDLDIQVVHRVPIRQAAE